MTDRRLSPGVFVREVPQPGPPPITPVETSVTGFVGGATRGPRDTPVPIGSWGEFERTFGPLTTRSHLGYSVRDFFRNGGRRAIVVRVGDDDGSVTDGHLLGTAGTTTRADAPGRAGPSGLTGATERAGAPEWVSAVREADTPQRTDPTRVLPAPPRREGTGADEGTPRGIRALAVSDHVGLIVVPPNRPPAAVAGGAEPAGTPTPAGTPRNGRHGASARDPELGAWTQDPAVTSAVVAFAEERRAMAVLDAPPGWTTRAEIAAGVAALPASADAAVYLPRVTGADPLRRHDTSRAPSGAIAGVIARVDATEGVWSAPAGADAGLAGIGGLTAAMHPRDLADLAPLGVNALRHDPGRPVLVWGARTRATDPEYVHVPVRRTARFLEESIERGLAWTVFEPNDANLRARVRAMVEDFLDGLFRAGAFRGSKPEHAYFVRADGTTTTAADAAAGRLHVLLGFAMLRPAEFTTLRITARTAVTP